MIGECGEGGSWPVRFGLTLILFSVFAVAALAEFDSGSNGDDGALDYSGSPPGTVIDFDPQAMGIDADGDSIFHFTTVVVPAEVTLRFRADKAGYAPIQWLVQGDVTIAGTLDLRGNDGHPAARSAPRLPSIPGPGGFPGGPGSIPPVVPAMPGHGPGGSQYGASHATQGEYGPTPYGTLFLLPLLGGSGGGGDDGGGGAGGGAILIASSATITVNGEITVRGGSGANGGSGGSGGAIRLVGHLVAGSGSLEARGGLGRYTSGAGWIRIESAEKENLFDGSLTGVWRKTTLVPNPVVTTAPVLAAIRIVTVGGVAAPANPTGLFDNADVTVDAPQEIEVVLESTDVPADATIDYTVTNESEGTISGTFSLNPPDQTEDPLRWSATITFPAGFSRIYTRATWDAP